MKNNTDDSGGAYIYKDNKFKSPILEFKVDSIRKHSKSRVIGAPVETGQITFDNKVVDPYDLVVRGTIIRDSSATYKRTMEILESIFLNRGFEFYSVRDGAIGYKDLTLVSIPSEHEYTSVDWLQVELTFSHVMMVQSDGLMSSSSNSENSDTRHTGYSRGTVR